MSELTKVFDKDHELNTHLDIGNYICYSYYDEDDICHDNSGVIIGVNLHETDPSLDDYTVITNDNVIETVNAMNIDNVYESFKDTVDKEYRNDCRLYGFNLR